MNFKKVFMQAMSFATIMQLSMFGMMRRVAPKVLPTTPALTTQSRHLVPGQEKHPAWVAANKDVQRFKANLQVKYPTPIFTSVEIPEVEKKLEENFLKKASLLPSTPSTAPNELELQHTKEMLQIIISLLKKHGIDPDSVNIHFISPELQKDLGLAPYNVTGQALIISKNALYDSPETITACIEHEIGHLINHDTIELFLHKLYKTPEQVYEYYSHLMEKRADTHSGIQSKQNVKILSEIGQGRGYDSQIKAQELLVYIQQAAPALLSNLEFRDLVGQPIFDALFFEKTKQIAMQEYKARTISPAVLQEIIKLCDKPTYLDDLLRHHKEQK